MWPFGWLFGKIFRRKKGLKELPPVGSESLSPVGTGPGMQQPFGEMPHPFSPLEVSSKDIEILSSKIDLVNSRLENLNQRLASIERYLHEEHENQRRRLY